MDTYRRSVITAAAALPVAAVMESWAGQTHNIMADKLLLTTFEQGEPYVMEGAGWRGFSDRVMGGISDVELTQDQVEGKQCLRLTGNVTRESNGGFVQMALYFGRYYDELDASAYQGVELLVYGNNEDYNLHVIFIIEFPPRIGSAPVPRPRRISSSPSSLTPWRPS